MNWRLFARWTALTSLAVMLPAGALFASEEEAQATAGSAEGFTTRDYERARLALFDQLRSADSPRQQVLAARLYVAEEHTASGLRPKPDTVVARAVSLGADDALVQWIGAQEGNYYSSQCGPTNWPETEVANLLRLEPDNAAAWQFAVALAHASGHQDGIDDALSRMAAAPHAEDHFSNELTEWRKAYAVDPSKTSLNFNSEASSPEYNALMSAMMQVSSRYSSATRLLRTACTEDAGERTWQRLGWCADAARTLASKGSSLALRKQGLELLEAIGDRSDSTLAMQQQVHWLESARYSSHAYAGSSKDEQAAEVAIWDEASSEIAALEQKLKRAGKALVAPADWVDPKETESRNAESMEHAYFSYIDVLIDDLSKQADVRAQALAVAGRDAWADSDASPDKAETPEASIAELAAANLDNLAVQWLAIDDDASRAAAISNLQRLDPDNGATRAFSLIDAQNDPDKISEILARIAAAKRYDDQQYALLGLIVESTTRNPPPSSMQMGEEAITAEATGMSIALMLQYGNQLGAALSPLMQHCKSTKDKFNANESSCKAIGRLLLHRSSTLLATKFGEAILRNGKAMDEADMARARQLAWWSEPRQAKEALIGENIVQVVRDILSSESEIEAMRLAAQRRGAENPPADWRSREEQRMTKSTAPGN